MPLLVNRADIGEARAEALTDPHSYLRDGAINLLIGSAILDAGNGQGGSRQVIDATFLNEAGRLPTMIL